jgi:hypothetical protein
LGQRRQGLVLRPPGVALGQERDRGGVGGLELPLGDLAHERQAFPRAEAERAVDAEKLGLGLGLAEVAEEHGLQLRAAGVDHGERVHHPLAQAGIREAREHVEQRRDVLRGDGPRHGDLVQELDPRRLVDRLDEALLEQAHARGADRPGALRAGERGGEQQERENHERPPKMCERAASMLTSR